MAKRKDADLAAWFYSDDKNEVEVMLAAGDDAWADDPNPSFSCNSLKYRKKERKFNGGEWYPVMLKENGKPYVMIYDGTSFRRTIGGAAFNAGIFSTIGESLGKLNFGGKV